MKEAFTKLSTSKPASDFKPWKTDILDKISPDWWKMIESYNNNDVIKVKKGDTSYILRRIRIDEELGDHEKQIEDQIKIMRRLNGTQEFSNIFLDVKKWSKNGESGFEILTKFAGEPLSKIGSKLSVKQILNYAYSSLDSMIILEKYGILNSDIKPGHLLIDQDKITLIGFNVAKDYENFDGLMKMQPLANLYGGTPVFCPPEVNQYLRNGNGDEKFCPGKMDVYCWGMSFYQILAQLSLEEIDRIAEIRKSQVTHKDFIASVKTLESKVCPESGLIKQFIPILLKTLEYDPKNRPTSSEVKKMMDKFMDPKGIAGIITQKNM